jgi:hypothetical protein
VFLRVLLLVKELQQNIVRKEPAEQIMHGRLLQMATSTTEVSLLSTTTKRKYYGCQQHAFTFVLPPPASAEPL